MYSLTTTTMATIAATKATIHQAPSMKQILKQALFFFFFWSGTFHMLFLTVTSLLRVGVIISILEKDTEAQENKVTQDQQNERVSWFQMLSFSFYTICPSRQAIKDERQSQLSLGSYLG